MRLKEAIVLAGGLGTRLKEALPGLPKSMAPVNGKPFLHYLINYLKSEGIERFVFALGFQSAQIDAWLQSNSATLNFATSIEEAPLGTGGAIKKALTVCFDENVLVVNGDTFFKADINKAAKLHQSKNALCTLIAKPIEHNLRYGTVIINGEQRLVGFAEKDQSPDALINGGMYVVNRQKFESLNMPQAFSFEKEFLQTHYTKHKIFAAIDDGYFIDIGIPEDYEIAKKDLPTVISSH